MQEATQLYTLLRVTLNITSWETASVHHAAGLRSLKGFAQEEQK